MNFIELKALAVQLKETNKKTNALKNRRLQQAKQAEEANAARQRQQQQYQQQQQLASVSPDLKKDD